jgi:ferricrocin synthase
MLKRSRCFNANLNLHWHGKQTAGNAADDEALSKPLDISVPTDFAPQEPTPGDTAVDGLETGYLAAQNLSVDIGPVEESDNIDLV